MKKLSVVSAILLVLVLGCNESANGPDVDIGAIIVMSEPAGGSVFINGALQTGVTTPAEFELSSGEYTIKASKVGYEVEPDSDLVTVFEGSVDTSFFTFSEISDTGYIVVLANYDYIPIYIDGAPSGTFTPDTVPLAPGVHVVYPDCWSIVSPMPETVEVVAGAIIDLEFDIYFKRTVLIEEFSHVNCINCPNASAAVHSVLSNYGDSLTAIEWHPQQSGGADPFQQDNPDMHDNRAAYYDFVGIPRVYVAGQQVLDPMSTTAISSMVGNAFGLASAVNDFALWGSIVEGSTAKVGIKATGLSDADGAVYLAVTEVHRHYDSAPGINGMTDFYNVPRRLRRYPESGVFNISAGEIIYMEIDFDVPSDLSSGEYSVIVWFQRDADGIYTAGEEILCTPCYLY